MEETLPPITEDATGFEPTQVRQFTIFLENRVGRLQTLVSTLEQTDGKIVALSIEESADASLVRLIFSHPDMGRQTLRDAEFAFAESELLVVELPKSDSPLMRVCSAILAAEINIHYIYPLLHRPGGPALAIYLDDPTLAAQILIRKGFKLISQNDLRQ
jgi:hypothetical protein